MRASERRRVDLRSLVRALPGSEDVLAAPRQRLDRAGERLGSAASLDRRKIALAALAQKLARHSPQAELARMRERLHGGGRRLLRAGGRVPERPAQKLASISQRLGAALAARIRLASQQNAASRQRLGMAEKRLARARTTGGTRRAEKLRSLAQVLATLGYRNVLARGYALVRDGGGHPLHGTAAAQAAAKLEIEFYDGKVQVVHDGRKNGTARGKGEGQASLF